MLGGGLAYHTFYTFYFALAVVALTMLDLLLFLSCQLSGESFIFVLYHVSA